MAGIYVFLLPRGDKKTSFPTAGRATLSRSRKAFPTLRLGGSLALPGNKLWRAALPEQPIVQTACSPWAEIKLGEFDENPPSAMILGFTRGPT